MEKQAVKTGLMEAWHEIMAIARREVKMIFADRRLTLSVVIVPIFYSLLMGFIYSRHIVTDIPVALVMQDNSAMARQLVRMIDANQKLHITYRVQSENDIQELMRQGKVDAGVIIPRDFALRIKRGEAATIGGFVNASTLVPANTASAGLNVVVQTFSTGVAIQKLRKQGLAKDAAIMAAMPVKMSLRPMYNPSYNYSNFMVPGLFITIIQQVILMGIALSFAGEREDKTLKELMEKSKRSWCVLVGKALPYFVSNLIIAEFCLRVLFPLNDIPMEGGWMLAIGFTTLFIATIVTWGLWVSSFCNNRLFATQILMFIALPSFILSGFTWPLEAMPSFIRGISYLLPMTHFVTSFRSVYLAGASFSDIYPSFMVLLGFLSVNIVLALWGIKRLMREG